MTSTSPSTKAHHHHHHHHHHHDMQNHDHHSLGAINAAHFDTHVADPANVQSVFAKLQVALETTLVERREWYGLSTHQRTQQSSEVSATPIRLLDYACGGGLGTRTLLPYVDSVVGMDVSGKSIDVYNTWAKQSGVEERTKGVKLNLMTDDAEPEIGLELSGFDVAIIVMALHHVTDSGLLMKKLAQRLKAGGRLVIIDWDSEKHMQLPDSPEHTDARHTAHRMGFSGAEMEEMYNQAGFEEVQVETIEKETDIGTLFISKGTLGRCA